MKYRIAVIGLGNVGIATALALASKGYPVIGLDIDKAKVDLIKEGKNISAEPGLDDLSRQVVNSGLLKCTTNHFHIQEANLVFVTVGSPEGGPNGLDTTYADRVAQSLGENVIRAAKDYVLIVLRTTVPLSYTRRFTKILEHFSEKEHGIDFGVCYSPENLAIGSMIQNILGPEFLIIGEIDKRAGDYLESFYREFYGDNACPPIFRVSPEEAEVAKLALNAYLSTKITFANTIAEFCDKTPNVDAINVLKIVGADSRVGKKFIKPGMSYGGQCLPKDLRALTKIARALGAPTQFFDTIRNLNEQHKAAPLIIAKTVMGGLRGKTIAVLGLAYKAGISDTRESPSIDLINLLHAEGARVKAYDPLIQHVDGIEGFPTLQDCFKGADCCIITTSDPSFKDILNLADSMASPIIIDGVRLFKMDEVPSTIAYYAVGLGSARPSFDERSHMKKRVKN